MSTGPKSWESNTQEEWNAYIQENSGLKNKTIVDVIGKTKPKSLMDWFKIIRTCSKSILTSPDKVGDRLRFFSLNRFVQPAAQSLGTQGQIFMAEAREKYADKTENGLSPPLSERKVQKMYDLFDKLNQDLLNDPAWEPYWRENREEILKQREKDIADSQVAKAKERFYTSYKDSLDVQDPPLTQKQIMDSVEFKNSFKSTEEQIRNQLKLEFEDPEYQNAQIKELKDEVLTGYRFKVITKTNFLSDHSVEDEPNKMALFRCQDFFQRINKFYRSKDASQCWADSEKALTEKGKSDIEGALSLLNLNIDEGVQVSGLIETIDKGIEKVKKTNTYEFLGPQKAASILKELNDTKTLLTEVQNGINLTESEFLPNPQGDPCKRILDNLMQASVNIQTNSMAFKNIESPIGKKLVEKFLSSQEAVDKQYNNAAEIRTRHFSNFLPNKVKSLVTDKKQGINWIPYPGARRSVIGKLMGVVKSDESKYGSRSAFAKFFGIKISDKQQNHLKVLQKEYFNTIKEEIKGMTKEAALDHLKQFKEDPLLKTISPSKFADLFSSKSRKLKTNVSDLIKVVGQLKSGETFLPNQEVVSPKICGNLLEKAQRVSLDAHEELSHVPIPRIKQPLDSVPKTQDPLQMLQNKELHEGLIAQLKEEYSGNPRGLMEKTNELFSFAMEDPSMQGPSKIRGFKIDKKNGFSDTQKSAMGKLQDLYMEAMDEAWKQCAREKAHIDGTQLPNKLSFEDKQDIYNDLFKHAQSSTICLNEAQKGKKWEMYEKMVDMSEELHAIGSKDLSQRQSSEHIQNPRK